MTPLIRPAVPADAPLIHRLVCELAEYERLAHAVRSTPETLGEALFGATPRVFCDIVETAEGPVGLAIWFYNFSTFDGRHGIYLEDLFVRPEARGQGLGKALLQRLARRCRDEGLTRLQWSVLDWNAPAIAFYRALGCEMLDEWVGCRLTGDALALLATPESRSR